MLDIDQIEFDAVRARLKLAIDAIVMRHRSAGDVLTWRLLRTIEDEAFEEIKAAPSLNSMYVRMLRSSPLFNYPRTDEPVNFGESNAIPPAFFYIERAFKRIDA